MINYKATKAILNDEVECLPGDYDMAVADATKCIDMLIDIAKLVNDSSRMSSMTVETIRTMVNREIKGSNERYEFDW